MRAKGNGPPYHRIGNAALYPREMVDQWDRDHHVVLWPMQRTDTSGSGYRTLAC
jgi:hypothetical protein